MLDKATELDTQNTTKKSANFYDRAPTEVLDLRGFQHEVREMMHLPTIILVTLIRFVIRYDTRSYLTCAQKLT